MREKILNAFSELGFVPEDVEIGYSFKYEGIGMLWLNPKDDEDFLSIGVPCIDKIDEDNADMLHALVEEVNSTLKYVKSYCLDGYVWMFYERELLGEEDLMLCLSHMIMHLEAGVRFYNRTKEQPAEGDE